MGESYVLATDLQIIFIKSGGLVEVVAKDFFSHRFTDYFYKVRRLGGGSSKGFFLATDSQIFFTKLGDFAEVGKCECIRLCSKLSPIFHSIISYFV